MPQVSLSPFAGVGAQFFDNNGVILTGGKIYSYVAGTTTPLATYTSLSGATPHANPIVLDSAGRVPGGEIWLEDGQSYKFVVETATGVLIGTYDNVNEIAPGFITVVDHVGDGVTTVFGIGNTPTTKLATDVYINGVYQDKNTYTVSGSNLTFTQAPPLNSQIEIVTQQTTVLGATSADLVSYISPGVGAVAQTVADRLDQTISVKDFGAACDAVYNGGFVASGTDDTIAIQAALDAAGSAGGGTVLLPGKSIISSTLYMPQGVFLVGQGANWGRGTNALTADPRNFIKSAIIHDPSATPFSMMKWQLGPDDGNSFRGVGGGARDLFVDGQRVAPVCMETMSWLNQSFQNVHTYDVNPSTGIGWLFSAFGVLGTAGAGVNRTTAFGNAYSCSHTGTGPKALVLAGSGWFNTAHMAFYNFLAESGTIDFEDCDSNELHNCAGNLILWGSVGPNQNPNGVAIGSARHNVMFGHRGSVTAKAGTSVPAVGHPNYNSHSNTVYGKTNDNNDQFPTIEAGADLTVWLPGFAKNDSRYGSFSVGGGVLQTRGALPAATVSIADATSTNVDWTVPASPHRNFLGAWNAANPSRLTIPAGVKWVRFSAYIAWAVNGTGVRFASIIRNGNTASRVGSSTLVGNASFLVSNIIQSAWLPIGPGESVQTGDYYEVRVRQESGGPLDMLRDEGSYFMVEFR